MKPFTVGLCVKVFRLLRELTPLMILRTRIIPRFHPAFKVNSAANDALIEIWSLGGLVLSVVFFGLCLVAGQWSWCVAMILGWVRVAEIVIVQINVLLFDWYGKNYALVSYLRTVLLLLQNYTEIVVWFAVFYAEHVISSGAVARPDWFDLLNLSFFTMTTFGQVPDKLANQAGNALPFLQAVVGLFMSSAILARFIGILPAPGTLDEQEQK